MPTELRVTLGASPTAMQTWAQLPLSTREHFAAFVADGWLSRTRRHHAKVIGDLCAAGEEAVQEWVLTNQRLVDVSRKAGSKRRWV